MPSFRNIEEAVLAWTSAVTRTTRFIALFPEEGLTSRTADSADRRIPK